MKISILQEHLYKSLSRATRIIGSKPQLPITSNILLEATLKGIFLTATNLETTIKVSLPGKVIEEGSICLPAKLITDLVATLPKETVEIETEQEHAKIKTGKTKTSMPGISATEYPPISTISSSKGRVLDKEKFISTLSKVTFSAATDEARPLLMGVLFEITDKDITVVTTDGYRLTKTEMETSEGTATTLVVPARALSEVIRIGQEEKEEKKITITETDDGQIQYEIGETQINTRQIEGEFPNYKKRLPTSYKTQAQIDTEELLRAVKSAAIFAKDSAGIIKIAVTKTEVLVSANTPQVGENTIEVEGKITGEENKVAINSRFLLDLLPAISGETLLLELSGALNPVVFKDPTNETFVHIVMPVRVQE